MQEFSFFSELQLLLCYLQFLIGFHSSRMCCHITGLLAPDISTVEMCKKYLLGHFDPRIWDQHIISTCQEPITQWYGITETSNTVLWKPQTLIFSLAHTVTKSLISTNQYQCYTQFKGIALGNGLQEKQNRSASDKWNLLSVRNEMKNERKI